MSYLGRKGAVAPLTSGDIPDGVIEGRDIAFLENASGTQNLGGTYSTERMYLNDSYTLTGDVTITGHLALGTVADSDVVITQDSTERTITGSGTLESGDLLSRQTDLTGMTGELGSAVTGSPAITGVGTLTSGTLGSAVTFPSGHVIQTRYFESPTTNDTNSTTYQPTNLKDTINFTAGNKIYIQVGFDAYHHSGGTDTGGTYVLSTDNVAGSTNLIGNVQDNYLATGTALRIPILMSFLYAPSGTSVTICLKFKGAHGGTVHIYDANSWMTLQEIQV